MNSWRTSQRLRRRSWTLLAFLSGVLLAGGLSGVALATNWGSNTTSADEIAHPCDTTIYSQCIADSGVHRVYLGYLTSASGMIAASQNAIAVYDAVTDVTAVTWSSPDADAVLTEADRGNSGYWAYTACTSISTYGGTDPRRWCYPQRVVFNLTHPSNWDGSPPGRDTVACHELGHTLGLRHAVSSQSSCMRSAQTIYTTITTHDHAMLNGLY